MDNDELNRIAAEELLKEAKRGEARAQVAGSLAWLPGTVPSTDKRFLANTLRHTMASNRVRERRGPPDRRGPREERTAVLPRPRAAVTDARADNTSRMDRTGGGKPDRERTDVVTMGKQKVGVRRKNANRESAGPTRVDGSGKRPVGSDGRTQVVKRSGYCRDDTCPVKKVKR